MELLTLVLFVVILLVDRFYRRREPLPVVNVQIAPVLSLDQPIRLEIVLPVSEKLNEPESEPVAIPAFLIEYIEQESDEWARVARRQMARKYYNQLQDWQAVLVKLQQEDRIG